MGFLHQDGFVTRMLGRFMDLVLVNVFWLVFSIPVITLGASTAALYDVTLRLAFSEDVSVSGTFFRAFVHNLKKGTGLFLIFFAACLILVLDFWSVSQWDTWFRFLFQVAILAAGYFYLALVSHVFAVLAWFDLTVKETVKKAFVLSMRNGIFTVFIMIVTLLPFLIAGSLLLSGGSGQMLFLILIFGIGLSAYLNSLHLARLFDPQRMKELLELRKGDM